VARGEDRAFEALSDLQLAESGARRATLDADAPLFSRLLLWTDTNHDGISQSVELEPFGKRFAGIMMGYVYNEQAKKVDEHGNVSAWQGWVTTRTGPGKNAVDDRNRDLRERSVKVYDVCLRRAEQPDID